jgi:hypothetical protein
MGARPFIFAAVPGRTRRAAWRQYWETKRPGQRHGDLSLMALATFDDLVVNGPGTIEDLTNNSVLKPGKGLRDLERFGYVVRGRSAEELATATAEALQNTGGTELVDNYTPHQAMPDEQWEQSRYLDEAPVLPRELRRLLAS